MIKVNEVSSAELVEVILEGRVVPVPCHHIEGRVLLGASEERAHELVDDLELRVAIACK